MSNDLMSSLLEELRNARETQEFRYEVGDLCVIVTVEQYLPGTAMLKRRTALMKLYEVVEAESVAPEEITTQTLKTQSEAQDEKMADLNENFCDRVIDIRREGEPAKSLEEMKAQPKISVDVAQELFPISFKTECVDWAMGGASPPDPENLTEEEQFSEVPDEQGE